MKFHLAEQVKDQATKVYFTKQFATFHTIWVFCLFFLFFLLHFLGVYPFPSQHHECFFNKINLTFNLKIKEIAKAGWEGVEEGWKYLDYHFCFNNLVKNKTNNNRTHIHTHKTTTTQQLENIPLKY